MQGYNVLMVYNQDASKLLMCKRLKEPYKGLNNLVGGKIEPGEDGLIAAYRELLEETNIPRDAITLHHLMDFKYYYQHCYVEVYVGKLNYNVEIAGDENELYWSDLDQNFFDMTRYAGEGNIGHMIEQVKQSRILLSAD
ncbi:NUDIX hydrolase [Paenibacillus sp. GCM10027626]|uniref:NUDIX hydrolase n=1 Tax=Paenibacillus sp. GCM10027626 TaxID=3273411 RepID=UPI00364487E9